MTNQTEIMNAIAQTFQDTATIDYVQCMEIVDASTTALQSERDIAFLFMFVFVMILAIKFFWNYRGCITKDD